MTLAGHPATTPAGTTTRLGVIDFLRSRAILAVIRLHAVGQVEYGDPYGRPAELPWISTAGASLNPLRMPLLIFLSGLPLPHPLKQARSYLLEKVRGIAWPYVMSSAFNLWFLWAMSPFRDSDATLAPSCRPIR